MSEPRHVAPGIEVVIPGSGRRLRIDHVLFDCNGTLAVDGHLVRGVSQRLEALADRVDVVVLTADTFGMVRRALSRSSVSVHIVRNGGDKRRFVETFGGDTVAAVGNGTNDVPMLRAAALGIAVLGGEGTAGEAVRAATIVARDIHAAIDLLLKPQRLVATLRR